MDCQRGCFANFNLPQMSKLAGQLAQDAQVNGSLDFRGLSSRCWESVRVTHGTGMGRKRFACAAEHECDSGEDESSKCDNKADGAFPAHPAGRRAFRPNTVYLRMKTSISKGIQGCGGDKCSGPFFL